MWLFGGDDDTMNGANVINGSDLLLGGEGNDQLFGRSGNDVAHRRRRARHSDRQFRRRPADRRSHGLRQLSHRAARHSERVAYFCPLRDTSANPPARFERRANPRSFHRLRRLLRRPQRRPGRTQLGVLVLRPIRPAAHQLPERRGHRAGAISLELS